VFVCCEVTNSAMILDCAWLFIGHHVVWTRLIFYFVFPLDTRYITILEINDSNP